MFLKHVKMRNKNGDLPFPSVSRIFSVMKENQKE